MKKLVTLFTTLFIYLLCSPVWSQQIAFPGAEGFGKYATGGRGGRVIEVTNLKDLSRTGQPEPGSFRAAVNTEGEDPITIVFRVSGNIELMTELKSGRSNMTIAGQTAPGDGITFKDNTIKLSGNNLIVRYIRFRPGDLLREQTSALNIENAKNFIVDHCSMSWSVEENTGFYDNVNSTIQWCIISEGLYEAQHAKGARSYGGQWGGQYASYHHNLLAHNNSRAPRINGSRSNDTVALVDIRNNVIYNWMSTGAVYGGESEILVDDPNNPGEKIGGNYTNMVNNYYKPGPATPDKKIFAQPYYESLPDKGEQFGQWYFSGNIMEGDTEGLNENNWLGVDVSRVGGTVDDLRETEEFEVADVTTHSAQEALELVLENAGAILPERDEVDSRIVAEIRGEVAVTGNGIIDSPSEVGGWPEMESLPAPTDTDKDGMPDAYETENGLDPEDPEDGKIITESGYSNLEIYLNSITESQHGTEPEPEPEPEPTGVKDSEGDTKLFNVYPNPSEDKIFFNSNEKIKKVEVYNLAGKKVLTNNQPDKNNYLSLSKLDTGIYVIKAAFYNGRTAERKVQKQ